MNNTKRFFACGLLFAMLILLLTSCSGTESSSTARILGTIAYESSATAKLYDKLDDGYTVVYNHTGGANGSSYSLTYTDSYTQAPDGRSYEERNYSDGTTWAELFDGNHLYELNATSKTYSQLITDGYIMDGIKLNTDLRGTKGIASKTLSYYGETFEFNDDYMGISGNISYYYDASGSLKHVILRTDHDNGYDVLTIKYLSSTYHTKLLSVPSGYTYVEY